MRGGGVLERRRCANGAPRLIHRQCLGGPICQQLGILNDGTSAHLMSRCLEESIVQDCGGRRVMKLAEAEIGERRTDVVDGSENLAEIKSLINSIFRSKVGGEKLASGMHFE